MVHWMKRNISGIVLTLMFVLGFLATFSYGKYWDEKAESRILYAHVKEYVMSLLPEDSQIYQDYNDNVIPRISENREKDHGSSAYYPIHPILQMNISETAKMYVWHIHSFLIFFLGVLCLYYVMKNLFKNEWLAIITTFMYYTTPRIFAQGHYNNKDLILLSFGLCLMALFLSLLKSVKIWKIVVAAFVAAILSNSKLIGVAIVGAIACMYFFSALSKKEKWKNIGLVCGLGLVLTALFYFLLTPAMWRDPIGYFEYVVMNAKEFQRWDGYVRFLGTDYRHKGGDGLPEWYLIAMILITTPIHILVCSFVGHVMLLIKLIKEKINYFKQWENVALSVLVLFWMLPLGYAVLTNMMVYNDWRHFYFIYSALMIFAGYGIYSVFEKIRLVWNGKLKYILGSVLGACILSTTIGLFLNHPYEYCYYNILAGNNADEEFEMDYWNVSLKDAVEFVAKDVEKPVTVSGIDYKSHRGLKDAIEVMDNPEMVEYLTDYENEWKEAEYLIINKTYAQSYEEDTYALVQKDYELVKAFKAYGNTLTEIYKK